MSNVDREMEMTAARDIVRVHVASINTRSATELCIRSMRRYAGARFELTVGDGLSTDGSLDILRRFERRGWLDLEVALGDEPRMHGEWLDLWLRTCPNRYCVFCDSDVEFLGEDWLADMLTLMNDTGCALVCAQFTPANSEYVHPVYDTPIQLGARPSPWLMLLDLEQVRDMPTSFLFHEEPATDTKPSTAYDVGGDFFRTLVDRELIWHAMPEPWLRKVHHFGGMSWGLPGGGGNPAFLKDAPQPKWVSRVRISGAQLKKRAIVRGRLERQRITSVRMDPRARSKP